MHTKTIFLLIMAITHALVVTVAVLIAVLFVTKSARILSRRRQRQWQQRLAPVIEELIRSGTDFHANSSRELRRAARLVPKIIQYILIYRSFGTEGPTHAALAQAYEELGFARRDLRRLRSVFWWVRAEGARCLGQMRCRDVRPHLLDRLSDRAIEVRLLSAWALGRIGDAEDLNRIIESLAGFSRLAGLRLSSTVFELGSKAVGPLLDMADHPDHAVRLLVVHLLGELRDTRVLPALLRRGDPAENKGVRLAAYKALGTLEDPRAAAILEQGMADGAWEVRAQAAKALGRVKATEAIPELCRAMTDAHWWVRRNAGEALTLLGKKGIAALQEVFTHNPDRFARDMAAQWLDDLGML